MTEAVRAIVLFGVSGSGKSTLGQLLAETLGATFLEGDTFHPPENVAKMRSGTPLTDADRWPWLAAIGAAIAREVDAGRQAVVACSALRRVYRDNLRAALARPENLIFVELDAPEGELGQRVAHRPGHFMPGSLLASQLATLEPLHADERGFHIMTGDGEQAALAAILRRLASS